MTKHIDTAVYKRFLLYVSLTDSTIEDENPLLSVPLNADINTSKYYITYTVPKSFDIMLVNINIDKRHFICQQIYVYDRELWWL